MPSSVSVGGIRMSVMTTSGRSRSQASREGVAVADGRDDLDLGIPVEQLRIPSRTIRLSSPSAMRTGMPRDGTRRVPLGNTCPRPASA